MFSYAKLLVDLFVFQKTLQKYTKICPLVMPYEFCDVLIYEHIYLRADILEKFVKRYDNIDPSTDIPLPIL